MQLFDKRVRVERGGRVEPVYGEEDEAWVWEGGEHTQSIEVD